MYCLIAVEQPEPDPEQMIRRTSPKKGLPEQLKQMEQLQQAYVNRAATILTPAQLEQFTQWEQQQSTMQSAGIKMAAQMLE